jgi:hypothetical protein
MPRAASDTMGACSEEGGQRLSAAQVQGVLPRRWLALYALAQRYLVRTTASLMLADCSNITG